MAKHAKVAVSLPADLLEAADRHRRARQQSRSQLFRDALVAWLQSDIAGEERERYRAGYRECPETTDELAAEQALAAEVLTREPWE